MSPQLHVKHPGRARTRRGLVQIPESPGATPASIEAIRAYTRRIGGYSDGRLARPTSPEFILTVPFAALVALIAALLETTVLPELPIAGATADLVLVTAVCAALVLGIEDGMAAAFLGGVLIDLLVPDRPLGAATLSLLVITGLAILAARFAGPGRRWMAVALTVVLTPLLHILLALILVLTQNAPLTIQPIGTLAVTILVAAFMNGVLAFPIAAMFAAIERRFGPAERVDW